MKNIQLSRNFWLKEMLWSDTAARMGKTVEASPEIVELLEHQCQNTLQPIRDKLTADYGQDMPLTINSGYRPEWLNTAIGGSKTSDHVKGLASDVECIYIDAYELACFIAAMIDRLPINQLILEFGDWVHIGTAAPGTTPKREILTAVKENGKTAYYHGLLMS